MCSEDGPTGGNDMNNFNPARAYGIVFGVIIGTLISVVLLMSINKNRSLRTEYDEMQKKARGEAYMYGFFTVLVLEVLLGLAETFGPLPMEPLVSRFLVIMTGVGVQAVYSIWHNAYIGLNTQTNKFFVMMAVIAAVNLLVAVLAWANHAMVVNGILQTPFANFMCFVLFAVLAVVGMVKKNMEEREEA